MNSLGKLHRILGKSRFFHPFFLKLRNQIYAIISHGLNDGIEMESNGELWLISHVAPLSKCFIDVGANKGEWSMAFIRNAKTKVQGLMFEPSSESAQFLKNKFSESSCFSKINLVEAAVSSEIGKTIFYEEPGCGESSSLIQHFSNESAIQKQVDVTTLDHEIKMRNIEHIDMLKIDAEGYDVHVIKGVRESLSKGLIDVVQFEYNAPYASANSTLHEALEIFKINKYEVFLLLKRGLVKFDYNKYGEFYHYSNFVAISNKAQKKFNEILPV